MASKVAGFISLLTQPNSPENRLSRLQRAVDRHERKVDKLLCKAKKVLSKSA